MISENHCYVYIVLPNTTKFVTAARFQISHNREDVVFGELIYGKKYLARTDAVELDPVELKLSESQYQTTRMNGFFGAIRDAMPDYWGRKVIEYSQNKIFNDFNYLLLGPDDRAGALGFGLNVEPPAPERNFSKTLDLSKLQKIANDIITDGSNHPDVPQIEKLLLQGTSMGGARPKNIVEDNNELWIAKFSTPSDRWDMSAVEHAMLELAQFCGLNVAKSKIATVADKNVLLVKRFDRDRMDNDYYRYRMISALTVLRSDDDPTSRENWSYLVLADEIRKISSHPKQDLRELFSRMCFNALISNTDDHPRNHAFIAKEGWRLSPAYDLTPNPEIARDKRFLAMSCGDNGRIANRENLLSGHSRFLLTKEDAEHLIDKMAEDITQNWYKYLRHAGVSEKDCNLVSSAFVYDGFYYHE